MKLSYDEHHEFPRRQAFTLVELLVVIAIMGILMALLLPAIASCREVARRAECAQNLGQIMMAVHQYESSQAFFPPAGWNDGPQISHKPQGHHQGWIISITPFLDKQDVYQGFDAAASVYAQENRTVMSLTLNVLSCPSDLSRRQLCVSASSYAGCYHDQEAPIAEGSAGSMVLNQPLARNQFRDGLAHTLFVGEKQSDAADLGWLSATRSSLRNTGHRLNTTLRDATAPELDEKFVGGFGSSHQGGSWLGFGDGNVKFVSDQIESSVLQQLGNRSDGKLLSDDDF